MAPEGTMKAPEGTMSLLLLVLSQFLPALAAARDGDVLSYTWVCFFTPLATRRCSPSSAVFGLFFFADLRLWFQFIFCFCFEAFFGGEKCCVKNFNGKKNDVKVKKSLWSLY